MKFNKMAATLALATAAGAASATYKDPNKDCFESPQYPNGTPACKPSPAPTPAPVTTIKPVTTVAPVTTVKPITTVAPVTTVKPITNVAPVTTVKPVTTVAPVIAPVIAPEFQPVTTVAPVIAPVIAPEQTQNLTAEQSQAQEQAQRQQQGQGQGQTLEDNSSLVNKNVYAPVTVYKAGATRAAPDAPHLNANGCWDGITLSAGASTPDVNVGGSVGFKHWSKDSTKCGEHEAEMKKIDVDAQREMSMRASNDPAERALAHEQAVATSPAYQNATTTLVKRVEQLSVDGKPVEVRANEWHKLAGLNINVRQPVVTTVTPPAAQPAQPCQFNLNQHFEYGKATVRAKATGTPLPAALPATSCPADQLEAARKAGAEAAQKAMQPK